MQVLVTVLGRFAVTVEGVPVEVGAWKSRRSVQLVALLALDPNRRLTTEEVMEALWPELPPEAARANLHKTATLARQAMGSKQAVVLAGDVVSLWPSADVRVDVHEFAAAAERAIGAGDPGACADLARRLAGELLPQERYEEWAARPRERVQRLSLDLLRTAGLWAELCEVDPTDEAAHRELMNAYFQAGRLHAAIRQFQRLRTVLTRELGVLPSPQTLALYRQIIGTATSGWVRPGLVGRETELVRARATLRRAAEGRPAAIFVTGPAGIGKTRVCEELVEQAIGEGWFVLRAAGREQTRSVPYWALVEAMQAVMVDRPYLGNALPPGEKALLARLAGLAPEQQRGPVHRHAVLHLLTGFVAATGASRTMLFLDDLQLVDDDTAALAEVLASAPAPRGALLVTACRADAHQDVPASVRSMVARGIGVEIALRALDRADTDSMVREVLDRPASDAELDLAWQLSEGSPFFALEVAAALSSDEGASGSGAYGAVDVRLERLPAETRGCLRALAIVADEFTADDLAAVAHLDGDQALPHLDLAMALGVVARHGSSYRFRHDLVRERLTQMVSDVDRAAAHRHVAEHLAGIGAPSARVVHHLLAAGLDRAALPWLGRAAGEAMAVGAHADALVAVNRAIQIAPGDPAMLALRADAMNGLGDRGAPAAYSVAIAASPEPERAALAVRRAKTLIVAGDVPAAIETLASVTSVPAAVRGQLHVARGLASWCTGALDEAEQAGQEAKRLAEESGDVRDFVDATMVLAMVAHERGAWPQRVSLDLLDPQLAPDLAAIVIDAHLCVAESYLYGGVPYPEVIEFASDLRRQAANAVAPRAEAFATTLLGEAHLLMGDTEAATPLLRSAAEQHQRVGVLCGEALSLQRLAQAALAEGDVAEADLALAGAFRAARGSPVGTRHLLDRVHGTAVRGARDLDGAVAAVDEAAHGVRGPLETCPPCSINFTVPAAIACADAGDLDRAGSYLAASEQIAAAFYPRGGWPAALDEVRSHVALAEGSAETAGRLLSAAIDAFDRLGQRLDAARCREQLQSMTTAEAARKV